MLDVVNSIGHRSMETSRSFGASVWRALTGPVNFVQREAWLRKEIAKAHALDDHILADIALSRTDIKHAVRGRQRLRNIVRD